MPLYHINVTLGERREVIVVDHVLQEYGVSEQEFYSIWLASDKRIQGDGDTFEHAMDNLFDSIDFKRHMRGISDAVYNLKGSSNWYTHGNELVITRTIKLPQAIDFVPITFTISDLAVANE